MINKLSMKNEIFKLCVFVVIWGVDFNVINIVSIIVIIKEIIFLYLVILMFICKFLIELYLDLLIILFELFVMFLYFNNNGLF